MALLSSSSTLERLFLVLSWCALHLSQVSAHVRPLSDVFCDHSRNQCSRLWLPSAATGLPCSLALNTTGLWQAVFLTYLLPNPPRQNVNIMRTETLSLLFPPIPGSVQGTQAAFRKHPLAEFINVYVSWAPFWLWLWLWSPCPCFIPHGEEATSLLVPVYLPSNSLPSSLCRPLTLGPEFFLPFAFSFPPLCSPHPIKVAFIVIIRGWLRLLAFHRWSGFLDCGFHFLAAYFYKVNSQVEAQFIKKIKAFRWWEGN